MAQNELLSDVATTIASTAGIDPAEITAGKSFQELGIDSMTMLEAIVALEDRFGLLIPDDEWSRFSTVGELIAHLERAEVVV